MSKLQFLYVLTLNDSLEFVTKVRLALINKLWEWECPKRAIHSWRATLRKAYERWRTCQLICVYYRTSTAEISKENFYYVRSTINFYCFYIYRLPDFQKHYDNFHVVLEANLKILNREQVYNSRNTSRTREILDMIRFYLFIIICIIHRTNYLFIT